MKFLNAVLFGIFILLFNGCFDNHTQKTHHIKSQITVGIVVLKQKQVALRTELPGRITAALSAQIRPQISGIVQARLFQEGSFVKKGTLLYRIDPSRYEALYEEAKASLTNAKASVAAARLKAKRYAELVKIHGVSKQDAEDAKVAYLQAKASVAQYQAALKSAAINLKYTKIKAPISGYIGISNVTVGALVTADQTAALATIRTLNPIFVDLTESSTQFLKLRALLAQKGIEKGSSLVTLRLEDGSIYPQKGTLKSQEIAVDENTGSLTLRAVFANPKGTLLPGMYVHAIINEAIDPKGTLVPQQAVMRDPKGVATVYIVNQKNRIERRTLKIDRAIKDMWLIRSGVKAEDRVVVEGTNKVKVGETVSIVNVTKKQDSATQ